ncbi:hypothetical protein ACCO45_004645 [Purpureocillium lilacinum]|uniref:Uncharacterized protein n=1 Tax=Purpureocillium lilacinum TaxID=33203 RepID=A0ACC4DW50_PURLI
MRWAAIFVAPTLCQLAAAQAQPAYGWDHAGKTNRPWDKNNPRPKWWDDRLPDSGVIRGTCDFRENTCNWAIRRGCEILITPCHPSTKVMPAPSHLHPMYQTD